MFLITKDNLKQNNKERCNATSLVKIPFEIKELRKELFMNAPPPDIPQSINQIFPSENQINY